MRMNWMDGKGRIVTTERDNAGAMIEDCHPLSRQYKIATDILGDGLIMQTTIDLQGEFQQRVMDTKDAQVRAKLIELGWTPPAG